MRKPYQWDADTSMQSDAARRIREIAEESGLEVAIIGDDDFQNAVSSATNYDDDAIKELGLTTRDCSRFKNYLLEAICADWTAHERECWYTILEERKSQ